MKYFIISLLTIITKENDENNSNLLTFRSSTVLYLVFFYCIIDSEELTHGMIKF